jgi:phenylalanyl-tRNA synthetase beta chain
MSWQRTTSRFTADEFQELCFDFGIELDGDTEEDPNRPKDQAPELAIEIPANRYDMLCFEGRALPVVLSGSE